MILYESELSRMQLHEAEKMLEMQTLPSSNFMSDDDFKDIMLRYAELMEQHRCQRLLLDTSQSAFTTSPELQRWTAENIAERTLRAGLRRTATVLPKDIFAAVSLEQLMDEKEIAQSGMAIRYFGDRDEAIAWLTAE